jgi:hypothetical protein
MEVQLAWYEMDMAIMVANARTTRSWRDGRQHAAGYKPRDLFDVGVKAAGAEIAVAKALNLYWDGSVDTFKTKADVGNRTEVRMTSMRTPKLIVRPKDMPERDYVLVQDCWEVGSQPQYKILGWLPGFEAKQDKYLTDNGNGRPPAYMIPVEHLRTMEDYDANYS